MPSVGNASLAHLGHVVFYPELLIEAHTGGHITNRHFAGQDSFGYLVRCRVIPLLELPSSLAKLLPLLTHQVGHKVHVESDTVLVIYRDMKDQPVFPQVIPSNCLNGNLQGVDVRYQVTISLFSSYAIVGFEVLAGVMAGFSALDMPPVLAGAKRGFAVGPGHMGGIIVEPIRKVAGPDLGWIRLQDTWLLKVREPA